MIFLSDFHWDDLEFFAKILIFLGFLAKINCHYLAKKSKKSMILARSEKNPKSWQEIQSYPTLFKIIAREPGRQALGELTNLAEVT